MRILHLVSYSLYSGPLPPTLGLARAQRALGHEVYLAYDVKRGAFNDFEEPAAPLLEGAGLAPPAALTLSAKSTPVELWRDRRELARLMTGALDVVHVHLSHDHLLAALARPRRAATAIVRTVHADRSLVRRIGQGFLHRRAEGFVARAEEHASRLAGAFGVERDRVAVIPSGFDLEAFPPTTAAEREEARARFGIPSGATVVAHVALIADRGQLELASAVASVPEARRPVVLFVGRGEAEPALREHVRSLGLEPWVRFAGYLRGPDLRLGYAAADLAFLARPGNDGAARAGLEAMAASVPLLVVRTGALGELVDGERGYGIASVAPGELAAGLTAALADGRRAERAARARLYLARERTPRGEAEATLAAYEAAIGRRRNGGR